MKLPFRKPKTSPVAVLQLPGKGPEETHLVVSPGLSPDNELLAQRSPGDIDSDALAVPGEEGASDASRLVLPGEAAPDQAEGIALVTGADGTPGALQDDLDEQEQEVVPGPEGPLVALDISHEAPAVLVSAADTDLPILTIDCDDAASLIEGTDEASEVVWKRARFGMVSLALPAHMQYERERARLAKGQFRLIGVSLAIMFVAVAVAYGIGGPGALLELGYLGVFLSALISSASMVIPVPLGPAAIALGVLIEAPFNVPPYVVVGLIGGTGSAIGELTGYMAGKAGSCKLTETRIGGYITRQMQRYGRLAVLGFAVVPNPFLDVVGIAAGCGGMPIQHFLMSVWPGKLINYTLTALIFFVGAGAMLSVF